MQDKINNLLKERRISKGLTMKAVAEAVGVSEGTVSRWESGKIANMGRSKIYALSKVLGLSPAEIMEIDDIPNLKNVIPLKKVRYIPVIGRIACGTPILAQENHTDNIVLPDSVDADFALICEGDSMINAKIDDGDTVYIHIQPEVENGEIAAVRIDDEVTLKKVFLSKDLLKLVPANDEYEPFIYTSQEAKEKNITIIGKAVAILKAI